MLVAPVLDKGLLVVCTELPEEPVCARRRQHHGNLWPHTEECPRQEGQGHLDAAWHSGDVLANDSQAATHGHLPQLEVLCHSHNTLMARRAGELREERATGLHALNAPSAKRIQSPRMHGNAHRLGLAEVRQLQVECLG